MNRPTCDCFDGDDVWRFARLNTQNSR